MARHDGLALLGLAALILACGVATAAALERFPLGAMLTTTSPGGTPALPGKAAKKLPPNTRYQVITPRKFSKRNYELACDNTDSDANTAPCYATCPADCPNKCIVVCPYCMSYCLCDFFPGTSCGDPRFTGGDGNTFYFHGRKDEDFCILSDAKLHINAHFIGKRNPAMNRDFTWVQALGVRFDDRRLYIGAKNTTVWDDDEDHIEIALDGEPVDLPAEKNALWVPDALPSLSVTRTDTTNTVVVEVDGVFRIMANAVPITEKDSRIHGYGKTEGDSLVHLDVGFKFHALTDDVHGVLGQTYRPDYVNKLDIKAKMPVMGGAPSYRSQGLFATDCAVSRFHGNGGGVAFAS